VLAALRNVGFLVSLELRSSAVTDLADVVLPVAPATQKAGSYLNWEGRARPFDNSAQAGGALPDCRVLDTLAIEMDVDLFTQTPAAAAGDLARLGRSSGTRPAYPKVAPPLPRTPEPGHAVLATWRQLIDEGTLTAHEPNLAGTARPALLRVNPATAQRLGLAEGELGTVSTDRGSVTLPVALAELPDGVVWLPGNSTGSRLRSTLGAGHGDVVAVSAAQSTAGGTQ
jgi:NADH-quinone oxidoreductase subunit G